MILYELHAPLIFLARSLFNSDCINKEQLRAKLEEAMKILEEAATILTLEPVDTPEGSVGQVAKNSLLELQKNLDELIENA